MKVLMLAAFVGAGLSAPTHAAINAFGFTPGMSKQAVEAAATSMGLGVPKWVGHSFLVQGQDNYYHEWLFNFCNDKLYEVSQGFPTNFDQIANFVEASLREHGQPLFVSATGAMLSGGFVRPVNLYWKLDAGAAYLRLMQLPKSYTVIYQWPNSCVKVPT